VESVLVLRTLGAPERRLLRGRRGRSVEQGEPEPVPTARVTVVRPEPFSGHRQAGDWLSALRADPERADAELAAALRLVNRSLHAHRVSSADPFGREVSASQALVARIGFGDGGAVSEGRFEEAWELPRRGPRTRRSMEAPEERFAAILAGRERALPCEELVLRARADLGSGRPREAALQARIALESLLADLGPAAPGRAQLEEDRDLVGEAANAALRGELAEELEGAVREAVGRMEAVLRRHRLAG
jgi:hypothetical protein